MGSGHPDNAYLGGKTASEDPSPAMGILRTYCKHYLPSLSCVLRRETGLRGCSGLPGVSLRQGALRRASLHTQFLSKREKSLQIDSDRTNT